MIARIQLIDERQQLVLTANGSRYTIKASGVSYNCPGRLKNLPPQGPHVLADMVRPQRSRPGRPPRCTPRPPASRSFARGRDGSAAASGPGCPCRNHTAPHPPTDHAPPRDGLAHGSAGPGRRQDLLRFGRARRVQRVPAVLLGPGRTSRQMMVRMACSGSSSLSTVCVSARRISLGGAPTHTPGSSIDTNKPLGNCFQARMRCG